MRGIAAAIGWGDKVAAAVRVMTGAICLAAACHWIKS